MALYKSMFALLSKRLLAEAERDSSFLLVAHFHRLSPSRSLPALEGSLLHKSDLEAPGVLEEAAREDRDAVKNINEMPGPSTIANLLEFFYRDGFSRIHEIQLEHRVKYGKIFKSRFGPQLVVSIADRDMVAQVLRGGGCGGPRCYFHTHSCRTYVPPYYREGEDWLKMRSVLRQLIMRPRDVAAFSDDVNEVVTDLISRIRTLRSKQADGETVLNVNDLFFKYAMEGVSTILYECRLGCLEEEIPKQSLEYIAALHLMFSSFKTTMYAGAIPKWLRPVLPKPWEEFCSSWDGLFKFSQIHVDKKLAEIKKRVAAGKEVKGGLLTHMLVTREMSLEEIYANMTEMLLAGVDTTSFTLSWITYLLARHPEIQQQVYEEVVEKLGHEKIPVSEDIAHMPLIRGVVKETLRLFPVLPGNGRVTQEDIVVGGYLIPKGTQLAMCHYSTSMDEECFPAPNEFRPDRWIRKDNADRVENFGSIPFGYGIRSCVGRRIAELEMHLAVTR
ncbi:cytochrome P450, family 27, subfamily C, polypeptide 1-like, partial [Scleropages formosus]